eukprot:gene2958-4968_t
MGIGGAGGNAIENMMKETNKLNHIKYMVLNTDAQALNRTTCENKIQIGKKTTRGLGAGCVPQSGKKSAEENLDEVLKEIEKTDLLFLTAGMGGGTGTGASVVIGTEAKKKGILTVGVVCTPFSFEGPKRTKIAIEGIKELEKSVDTLIIIPNEHLFSISDNNTKVTDAFKQADNVLLEGVRSIIDLILRPGLINLDFADVTTVMKSAGRAYIGTGICEDEEIGSISRGKIAVEKALNNPLLDVDSIEEATNVLIHITGGTDISLEDVEDIANTVKSRVNEQTNIIVGAAIDNSLEKKVHVSLVITGIPKKYQINPISTKPKKVMITNNVSKPKSNSNEEKKSLMETIRSYW